MPGWLSSALDYIPDWLAFQMRTSEQPGCMVAIARRGRVVLERAWGAADLATGEPLTPRHRFRIASHTKSFTAAGILKLREEGKLRLDDPVGQFVDQLHASVARSTIAQLLSHSAGLIRDGRRCRAVPRPPPVPEHGRADGRPAGPSGDRAQHPLQILEPWLRPARQGDRGCTGEAYRHLDQARDRRCRRA